MAHTIRHRPANRSRHSKQKLRHLHLWITQRAQMCECCGLTLWGRRYTNAALQRVCRGCVLSVLPAQAGASAETPQMAQEGERC
jgi:hypothetical protein